MPDRSFIRSLFAVPSEFFSFHLRCLFNRVNRLFVTLILITLLSFQGDTISISTRAESRQITKNPYKAAYSINDFTGYIYYFLE